MEDSKIHFCKMSNGEYSSNEIISIDENETEYGCVVPLISHTKVIGVLKLIFKNKQHITADFKTMFLQVGEQVGAEIKRKQLENELNQIFSLAPDIICIVGIDGYFKKINPAACILLGYTQKELMAKPFTYFIHKDDVNKTNVVSVTLSEGIPISEFENRYITKDGKILTFLWTSIISPEGKLLYAIAKNITIRKEVEDVLFKANTLAKIGSWHVDLDTLNLFYSPITKQIFDVDIDYVPNADENLSFYKEGYYRNLFLQNAIKGFTGDKWEEDFIIVTAKKQEKWVRVICEAEMEDGIVQRLYGSIQDIDKAKKGELELAGILEEKNTILESIGDAFFAVDKNWIVTYWNKKAEVLWQTKKETVLGFNLFSVFNLESSKSFFTNYKIAVDNNTDLYFEQFSELINKWLAINVYPSETGLSVYCRDITNSKMADKNIRNSEEKRRLIMDTALNAIVCMNLLGNVTYWNPKAEITFGWTALEVMEKNLAEFIVPERYRERHEKGFKKFINQKSKENSKAPIEIFALNKAGYEFPIEMSFKLIEQENESFFCAFIKDITSRKLAEDALRHSIEQYNFVAKATQDAIWNFNIITGEIKRTGEGFKTLFGYENDFDSHESISVLPLLHPDDLENFLLKKHNAFKQLTQNYWEDEYRFKKSNGEYAMVYDKGYIIRDSEGNAIEMIGATRDVTRLKTNEIQLKELINQLSIRAKELAESNIELEQFAFVASHDLQEPLRMVTGFLSQLDKKYNHILDEKAKKYIHFAVDGAQRMRQIILDLLEYTRVGKTNENLEEVDLNETLNDIKILFRKQILEKKAVIVSDVLPVIKSYKTPLRQIFQNFISNALKYADNNRAVLIKIQVEELEGYWKFNVEDNGIGIDKEYFDKIFVIFQRLHAKDEYEGSGMGLTITKKLIESLGGIISVESEEGVGSIFSFTIAKQLVMQTKNE